ncbi:MAG: DUF302 domain-containing protein [Salinigranum sp.]
MAYYLKRRVDLGFEEAKERTTEALSDEGFGVLAEIDVEAALKEKLGLDTYRRYVILGACNPKLANRALEEEVDLGVLLPCNVVVYVDDDGETVVSAVDAESMLSIVDEESLDPIAEDVVERFERVLNSLPSAE